MKIYNHYSYGQGTIFVTPGADHPETTDWMTVTRGQDGQEFKAPVMFTVKFNGGVAEVPDNLGAYMIKKRLARRSPILIPEGVAA